MSLRPFLFLTLALAVTMADLRPEGPGWGPAAAWADDDDDDDGDDDDDDDAPVRRRQAPPPAARVAPLPVRAPNEVIARGLSAEDLQILRDAGFRVLRSVTLASGEPLHRLRKPDRMSMAAARAMVREVGSASAADFNHFYRPGNAEAACSGADCLARQMIAWPAETSGCGGPVRIGMVDTGLNADHAVLKNARIRVHRIDPGKGLEQSDALHGTAVASLLVGRPDSRTPGLVPDAELVAVDAFYKQRKDERADAFALVEALDYLTRQQVDIVNLSLAGPPNDALARQIALMAGQDIVLVAAAGNGGPSAKPAFPAAYEQVIAVTAVDRRAQVYRRANRGGHIDLAAPGVNVWTAASISGARTKTGTSFAAPFVTAAAALILQSEPGLAAAEVRSRLQQDARDLGKAGQDEIFGHGLIQPAACRG